MLSIHVIPIFSHSFVSVIHLLVGVVYCTASWSLGLPKRAVSFSLAMEKKFQFHQSFLFLYMLKWWFSFLFFTFQPIDKELLALLTPVAFCHALGHVMSNVSFATVAVSFTHTIKGNV